MQQLRRGKYTFTYDTYIDHMGFERESFDIFDTEARISRPFWGPPKVVDFDRKSPLGPLGYTRSHEELEQIFTDELAQPYYQ